MMARSNAGVCRLSFVDDLGPDREAGRLEVTRQSVIKVWIADRLERKVS